MLYNSEELKSDLLKQVEFFKEELKKVNTGKPNVSVIEDIDVDAYGTRSKLNTLGQVVIEDAVTVRVNIWDKNIMSAVEKALRDSQMSFNLVVDSGFIRLRFNAITEEDRKIRVKEVGRLLEENKIKVRQVRHKFMEILEGLDSVSEDEVDRSKESVQKEIDNTISQLEDLAKKKESDLMSF